MSCKQSIYKSENVSITRGCSGVYSASLNGVPLDVTFNLQPQLLRYILSQLDDNDEEGKDNAVKSMVLSAIEVETVLKSQVQFASIKRSIDRNSPKITEKIKDEQGRLQDRVYVNGYGWYKWNEHTENYIRRDTYCSATMDVPSYLSRSMLGDINEHMSKLENNYFYMPVQQMIDGKQVIRISVPKNLISLPDRTYLTESYTWDDREKKYLNGRGEYLRFSDFPR